MRFTVEQQNRLKELGALPAQYEAEFTVTPDRDAAFQRLDARLAQEQLGALRHFCEHDRQPPLLRLEENLAAALRRVGFIQVCTPVILSRSRLEKMGITHGHLMEEQIFWLDARRCLRPMLAPHLYEYMRELGRLLPRPLRLFEIGPCFRKETQGMRHANEFTMLNLVEMGLPDHMDSQARLYELGALILDVAGVADWRMEQETSAVYGETADFVSSDGMELASSAIGPLPMDDAFGITENWAGIGFGLERLLMTARGEHNLARNGRSLSYLNGIRMRV